MSTSFCN